jgi:hypothetical protein
LQVAEEIGHATSSSFGSLWYSDDNTSPEGQAKHLSKLFSNLVKGRTYLFRVAAKNEAGTGPFAAAVSNEAISVPLPPINFEAAVRSPFQIDLQWTAPPDTGFYEADMSKILRFELEQSTDQSFQTGVSANLIASQPFAFLFNFTAPIVTKGLRHYFRVWSVNEAGRSLYPTNISEQAIDVPSTPTQLSISITAVLQLTVQWRSVSNFMQSPYFVYVKHMLHASCFCCQKLLLILSSTSDGSTLWLIDCARAVSPRTPGWALG